MTSAAIQTAKAKAESLALATTALQRWGAIQEGILGGVASAQAQIATGKHPAVVVEAIIEQGKMSLRMISRIETHQAVVTTALAGFGFTTDEVSESVAYLRETAEMMKDAAQDGSDLSTLLTTIDQRHTAPVQI